MDEAEAIRRARQGDAGAFRWLVERDGDLVRRTAYLLVYDAGLAEDLAQEAFLSAWQGLRGFRTATGFRPWVLRILMNKVSSHRRKRRLGLALDRLRPGREPADPAPDPSTLALRSEDRRELAAAVETLPPGWKRMVVLRYYSGLSVPEVAVVLGVAEGTVKSGLHRALGRLREALGPAGGAGERCLGLLQGDGDR